MASWVDALWETAQAAVESAVRQGSDEREARKSVAETMRDIADNLEEEDTSEA